MVGAETTRNFSVFAPSFIFEVGSVDHVIKVTVLPVRSNVPIWLYTCSVISEAGPSSKYTPNVVFLAIVVGPWLATIEVHHSI